MKILMVGRKSMYNAEFFYEKAFRDLGHDVLLADSYTDVNHRFIKRQIHTRTGIFDFSLHNYWINKNIGRITDNYDPDAVIFFKGEFVSEHVLEKLSENRNICLFYPDTYKFRPLLKKTIGHFKIVFTAANNTDFYHKLGAQKIVTVPWACDPEFHRKMNVEKKYDVSFIGTAYPERRRIIRRIEHVDVFGDFWYGLGEKSHKPLYGDDFVKTINQSSINLNLQARISVEADAPTMRTFEIAGCGGFQISDYMPSIKRYFPIMPTFRDSSELREMIELYLNDREEMENIALRCMEICRDSFKYTDSGRLIASKL